jgi:Predicted rRNA methylase
MKKRIFVALAAIVCCFSTAAAQDYDFMVGASVGYSQYKNKTVLPDKALMSKFNTVTLFADHMFTEHFGATADVSFGRSFNATKGGLDKLPDKQICLFVGPSVQFEAGNLELQASVGPEFKYSKLNSWAAYAPIIDRIRNDALALGFEVDLSYSFNDEWCIFVNDRFDFDILSSYFRQYGIKSTTGFFASLGVGYSF